MKNTYNKLTCLFGHHDYSRKPSIDKHGHDVYLCKVCKRRGYTKWYNGSKVYHDYDKEGNLLVAKYSDGSEAWYSYNKYGNRVSVKCWADHDGQWKSTYNYSFEA